MDPYPLVSVVIPTYQRAAVLEEALRSAVEQSYRRLEILVEDDGSTDGSEAVVARFSDPRVRYAWEPNQGHPAPVRNRAFLKAGGELVAFLDSDDVWEREKVAIQVEALRRQPELLAVACNASWIPPRRRLKLDLRADVRPSFEEMLDVNSVVASGVMLRREVFQEVGFLDEDPELIEDYDFWLRLLRHRDRSILILAAPLVRYRASADAISTSGRRELERIRRIFAKHEDHDGKAVRRALARRELDVRGGELREGLRAGTLPLSTWLRAPEVPVGRRLRLAAKAVALGRSRV
jgi:glycosyltransferase involved in cell wall biosynthesis